jgi:predicted lipoprotein with Yx(FWY)xxD motif
MSTTIIRRVLSGAALLAVAGCGGAAATGSSSAGGGSTQASQASVTLKAATVSGKGSVVVAGSNGMTLYMFDMDTPGSNTSACTGGCASTWPPLTVPANTTPTAASGLAGTLSTFTRSDGLGVQVTYNGHPLHFYSGDTKPGDANGNYPHWSSVPASSGGAAAAPSATAASNNASPSNPYGY